MFTGIVKEQGRLVSREAMDGDVRLRVEVPASMAGAGTGDSIAVNGVCLTVAARDGDRLLFDVSGETLAATRLGSIDEGSRLNLEPALTASDPVGGHFVTGHVDGVGKVLKVEEDARSHRIEVEAPEPLGRYIAKKGSIAVDGVSLTINEVNGSRFGFNVIPHTWSATNMQDYAPGTLVHLEVDLIARYLERLMGDRESTPAEDSITADLLSKHGFTPPSIDDDEDEDTGVPVFPTDDPNPA